MRKNSGTFPDIAEEWSFVGGKSVVVACSGGPDSMTLLDMLRRHIIPSKKFFVAHVNHGLRPTAKRDEDIVLRYCKRYGIVCEVLQADIKKEAKKTKTTIEECARNIRKSWFEKLRKKYKADYIATAHQYDDQAETILYRIIKGTSITGLVGIQAIDGPYIRPLLNYTKAELLSYAKKHKIPFGFDETNDDIKIPRNLIRKDILPKLETINCGTREAFIRLSNSAKELHEGFDEFFEAQIKENRRVAPLTRGDGQRPGGFLEGRSNDECGSFSFSYDWYHSLPLGFQHELLRFLYEKANGSTHGLSQALINELNRFLSTRNGGEKIIKKLQLVKKEGVIFFQ